MRIKLWGVRGSLPTPLTPDEVEKRIVTSMKRFIEEGGSSSTDLENFVSKNGIGGYGGNSPCVEVSTPQTQVIIDAGTGIRALGRELMAGPCGKGQGQVHILMTHFHWDHLIGLPFFPPLFIAGNEVHFHAVQPDLEEVIRLIFKKPFFPVEFDQLVAKVFFHRLEPRTPTTLGDLTITPYQLDHPDPCWGYKIAQGDRAFSHCVDSETTRFTAEELGPDLPLYQGIDLMIFDAQYTLMESIIKASWGHGSALVGIDLAAREDVPRVVFMHHDPFASDEKIASLETETRKYYEGQKRQATRNGESFKTVNWCFAREGMTITL